MNMTKVYTKFKYKEVGWYFSRKNLSYS